MRDQTDLMAEVLTTARKAQRVHPENPEAREVQARREHLESLERLSTESQESPDPLETLDSQDHPENPEHLVLMVNQESRALMGSQEIPVHGARMEPRERTVPRENPGQMETRVPATTALQPDCLPDTKAFITPHHAPQSSQTPETAFALRIPLIVHLC